MRIKDVVVGETYNHIQIISDLGYCKPSRRYGCKCTLCGKEFEIAAKHIGSIKTCRECSEKSKRINLTGKRFGKLTALEYVGRKLTPNGTRQSMWRCKCDCGNETIVKYIALKSGNTQSCGCGEIENQITNCKKSSNNNRKSASKDFGVIKNHPLYKTWKSMLMRCNNSNARGYKHYGGRGIRVCDRWQGDLGFENFINDMGTRPEGTTLDRIDVNGNYEPSNCRWATNDEQSNNKTDNVFLTFGEFKISARQFCKRAGLNYWTVIKQINQGFDINIIAKGVDMRIRQYRNNSLYKNGNRELNFEYKKFIDEQVRLGNIEETKN